MAAPRYLLVVAGTGTEVGKTWVAEALLRHARASGQRVAARKPAQSFEPGTPTDAELLAAASGEMPQIVCPPHRWYPVPMAPPMAADVLARPRITLDELLAEISWPEDLDLGVVETAGGVRSPLAHDADNAALARRLEPQEVLLVADAGLGTLNAVRLSLEALSGLTVTVLLNRFDAGADLHRRNRDWLVERDHARVITEPRQWRPRTETGPDRPSRG